MNRLLLLVIGILIFPSLLLSQHSRFNQKKQFTIEDGLPSNECHDIVQDNLGYIWVATDKGLARWDGYEFKVYGADEGLKDLSCTLLFLDLQP